MGARGFIPRPLNIPEESWRKVRIRKEKGPAFAKPPLVAAATYGEPGASIFAKDTTRQAGAAGECGEEAATCEAGDLAT
jgi:hypothetical protein